MGEIINKVKSLDVITIDVKDFYAEGERAQIDLLDFLEGDILMEKNFRDKLKKFNWTVYTDKYVNVNVNEDLIIPSWAFLLVDQLNLTDFKNKKVIVKGCSDIPHIEYVYNELTRRLSKTVLSLMYGEPCSRVPIFKKRLK